MSKICINITPFVDGELSTEEADAFRTHLKDCSACQAELTEACVLRTRIAALRPNLPSTDSHKHSRPWLVTSILGGVIGLGLGLFLTNVWISGSCGLLL